MTGNRQPDSTITIARSEFAFNGFGKGYTHNIYVGSVGKFVLRDSYIHNANVGQTVKSRAQENYILYNRIIEGKASYAIDLSNGGYALVMGNIIYQGTQTKNSVMLSFGPEKYKYKRNVLEVVYNTFINERSPGVFVNVRKGAGVVVANNIFSGKGVLIKGDGKVDNNVVEKDVAVISNGEVKVRPKYLPRIVDKAIDIIGEHKALLYPEKQYGINVKSSSREAVNALGKLELPVDTPQAMKKEAVLSADELMP